ncbi:MAG: hypothetical protein ACKO5K_12995 [Armatimonadota bacterium]
MPRRTFFPIQAAFALLALGSPAPAQDAPGSTPATPRKAQHEVARKDIEFASVSANEVSALGAVGAADIDALRKRADKETSVVGKVVSVFRPDSRSIVLLNFARNYRDAITVGVKSQHFGAFPDLRGLEGKQVIVVGKIGLYRERPQILIEKPTQLRIVKTP